MQQGSEGPSNKRHFRDYLESPSCARWNFVPFPLVARAFETVEPLFLGKEGGRRRW